MIISHKYRYLFVETPHTGSTAIAHELVAQYGGESILRKHSSDGEFRRQATADEQSYFRFAGMRHPMDACVTIFFRMATDHRQRYSQPQPAYATNRHYRDEVAEFQWIRKVGADFPAWFMHNIWLPYDDWMSTDSFDGVIRFEHLQEDFAQILRRLGVEQVRPLPVENTTAARSTGYADYYTPATRWRAAYAFGPYMELFGYRFPGSWGRVKVPRRARTLFRLLRPWRSYGRGHQTGVMGRVVDGGRVAVTWLIQIPRRLARPVVSADDR